MPRPKKDIQQLCRAHTDSAVKTILGIMTAPKAAPSSRLQAAQYVIDRGWGKAPQALKHIGDEENPPIFEIRFVGVDRDS